MEKPAHASAAHNGTSFDMAHIQAEMTKGAARIASGESELKFFTQAETHDGITVYTVGIKHV